MTKVFNSCFAPGSFIEDHILRGGRITQPGESPAEMVERVVEAIYQEELRFSERKTAEIFAEQIGKLMDNKSIVFSTPVMTNAGRKDVARPLSACTVPPVNLRSDIEMIRNQVDTYHQEAMGTGFNFDDTNDPVATLLFLNDIAIKGSENGKEDRPVGNMGICGIDHPRIVEFITSKMLRREHLWKFNISVNTPESFWIAVRENGLWTLKNGDTIHARELFRLITQSAHTCACPGLIFLDRYNRDNPVPGMGSYSSVAPCAEVGLLPGETCQFGYINLGAFVENGEVKLERIASASEILVQALDNCLEISARAYQVPLSRLVLENRRKIGVGICGLADMFIRLGIPYNSAEARTLARDVVAFINYRTKIKSHELAFERGSFSAMNLVVGCRYNDNPGFLEQKYGGEDTKWVSADNWKTLGKKIRETKMLRHCSTVALPPTGRSGLVINASTGIEPLFLLTGIDGELLPCVDDTMRTILNSEERQSIRASGKIEFCGNADEMLVGVLATSTQISPKDQMLMLSSLQGVVDEAISKTINLPSSATIENIEDLYMSAYTENLKGITIYRDGTARSQPKKV